MEEFKTKILLMTGVLFFITDLKRLLKTPVNIYAITDGDYDL